ncbi:MAG: arsenite methyltransferase [Treponema sp.]|jgi:SAM-dependent methyltransferase|nr:arsenite methyltransferase [Treponema sp.]
MENEQRIKEIVRDTYGKIASENIQEKGSCCSTKSCCSGKNYNMMAENYTGLDGYNPDADLGLGCGLPTKFAKIKKGDTVIDLGSGAGNDCFVARAEAGDTGRIIGIDFTQEMIEKAKNNEKKLGFANVEFILGDIDNIPVESNLADVIVSNCVLNLVPNKKAVFNEIYRVLKPNGHFSISDIILTGNLPDEIKSAVEMYAACITGAISKDLYLKNIEETGFRNIEIQKEVVIDLPEDFMKNNFSEETIKIYNENPNIIKSITVYAEK